MQRKLTVCLVLMALASAAMAAAAPSPAQEESGIEPAGHKAAAPCRRAVLTSKMGPVLLIPESTGDVVGMYSPADGTYLGDLIVDDPTGTNYNFQTPKHAIQGPDGNIYVSDQVSDAVYVFDTTGAYLSTYCSGYDNLRGIAFRDGHLFVTSGTDTVYEFSGPNTRLRTFIADGSDPFDIHFLPDGRALLSDIAGTGDNVRLYDTNGVFIAQIFPISFPQQIQADPVLPGAFLNAAFTTNVITDFGLDSVITASLPYSGGRGVYRLGNGNLLATSSRGVEELDAATGTILQVEHTGNGQYIELFHFPVSPQINYIWPPEGSTQVHRAQPLVLGFSQPMDPGSIDGYTVPGISGDMTLTWNAANDTLRLLPDSLWGYNTEYLVILTAGANPSGVSLAKLPDTLSFTTWMAPDVIQDQLAAAGSAYVCQVFGDYPSYSSYLAEDINLAGMDSVKVTAVEIRGNYWTGHSFHQLDSLYMSFTSDSSDYPAWSQEIWGGNLLPASFDDVREGLTTFNTFIAYLDPPVMLGNGQSWLMCAPQMNLAAKDGQWGWCQNDPAAVYGTAPAWRNPGGGFGYGTDWQRASVLGATGDLVYRALGYAYPTGVSGGPSGATKAAFSLMPNFPNPVSGRTNFAFSLPRAGDYTLRVYNVAGQAVKTFSGQGQAGPNAVAWNSSGVVAGVYFFQLNAGGLSATRKLVVVK